MSDNIFNIEETYLGIIAEIEANEGEITPELEKELEITEEARDEKMQAYAYIIKQKEANSKVIDDEIARLKALKETNINTIKRLKKTLITALKMFDLRNKNGNFAYRLPYHNTFTRKTKSVEVLSETFDEDTLDKFSDLFTFKLNDKLSKLQADAITALFAEEDLDYFEPDYTVELDKNEFKETVESYKNEGIDTSELDSIATINENISLTIQ